MAVIATRSLGHEAVLQAVAVPQDTLVEFADPGVLVESAGLPLGIAVLGGLLVLPDEADLVELHETLVARCEDVVPLTVV